MGMMTTYPPRLRQEPVDLVALDMWQDAEGLLDASDATVEAWRKFSKDWRLTRALDLARTEPEPPLVDWRAGMCPYEKSGMDQARVIGGYFALCRRVRGERRGLSPARRKAFRRWQARLIPHAPDVYSAQWALLDDIDLATVATRYGEDAGKLGRAVRLAWKWLAQEVYQQQTL